jgi:sorbitol/mannitol transport system permease protein
VTTETETAVPTVEDVRPADTGRRRRRKKVDDSSVIKAGPVWAIIAWAVTLFFFAPVAWMVLTSFHT